MAATLTRTTGIGVVAEPVGEVSSGDDLRQLATSVRDRVGSDAAVIALAGVAAGRPVVIVATNEAARSAGLRAGALAKVAAGVLGGGGGGRDDVAQGGGTDAGAIAAALAAVRETVERQSA